MRTESLVPFGGVAAEQVIAAVNEAHFEGRANQVGSIHEGGFFFPFMK
jgi:hypothetical protein